MLHGSNARLAAPGREFLNTDSDIGTELVVNFLRNVNLAVLGEKAITLEQWYELRVAGSAGTSAGIASGAHDGIAVGGNGRLCSLTSGAARRFESKQEALDYLGKIKVSGDYQFEAVLCHARTTA